MRRAPIVLSATGLGLAAVLTFQPRHPALPTISAPTSSSPGGAKAKVKTATGRAVSTQYGISQVRVAIAGAKITNVEAVQLPGREPKSVQISSSAESALRRSALTKQSAAIDAVSGATFTSASYESSLQSALDQVGYTAPDGSRGSSQLPQGGGEHGGGGDGGPPPGAFQ